MDLNMMMREQARTGLQTRLDTAVTNGDTAEARKLADEIAKLDVMTAPKSAVGYGDAEIRAELNKLDWFGTDPKKSAKAMEFGKTMDPKKFASAEAFAAAIVKAVDEEFKPAAPPKGEEGGDDDTGDGEGDDTSTEDPPPRKKRATDGPGENDRGSGTGRRAPSGPWAKLSDAPADIQREIKRQADKFVPTNAKKETRDAFVSKALESHYATHQRNKGKK